MKKIVLILAGALALGTVAVQAQDQQPKTDSTAIAPPTPPAAPTPAPDANAVPAYRKDMAQIQPTEVPAGVKSTLDRPQFKGWETGSVYSNADKSIFIVEVKDETEGRMKVYRLDAEGKPVTDN